SGIRNYKNGFFQKLAFTGTWIPRGGEQSIGWTQWEVALSVGLPAPTIEWPLLVTPGFTVWHTDGPAVPDLPAELYQASLGLTWLPKISDRWRLIISATPGVYSDFEQTDSAAWRITGLGLGVYDWVPDRLQLILGAVYLDRDDFNILPAVGLIWTPNPDVKLELVMPRPRFGLRWDYGPGFENWFYLAGEIGGGTWQIEMTDGTSDRVTIRDFRVLLGYEHKRDGGAGHQLEIGYVLGREIEFRHDPRTFSLDDGLLLRAGIAF
ncbi:MAG: hypothetical protein J5I93_27055, partial [Pirellulaceae bacterium]|nr:hypothetical protein [Pirellulaceae bacterium]